MGDGRPPGPTCGSKDAPSDRGTLMRERSSAIGPVGGGVEPYAQHKTGPGTQQTGGQGYFQALRTLWDLTDLDGMVQRAVPLSGADIMLREIYKLNNQQRGELILELVELFKETGRTGHQMGTLAWVASFLRNAARRQTQTKLTLVGRLLSKWIEKKRDWEIITQGGKGVRPSGDPFAPGLTEAERYAISKDIVERSMKSSPTMNWLQNFGRGMALLGVALSGWQIGEGLNKIRDGRIEEGAIDVAEGGSNLGLSIGVTAGVRSGSLVIAEGTGLLTNLAGLAAAGSLALAFAEARRAARGEKSMATEARDYWKGVQDRAVEEGPGFVNASKYVGAVFAEGVTGFIADGQYGLWGLLD